MYTIIWTTEKQVKAINILTKYFEKHGVGEFIQQSDDALIGAPDVMAQIADEILKEDEGILLYNPKEFDNWLGQFIKGKNYGTVELQTGEILYYAGDKYQQWRKEKLKEFKNQL